MEGRHLGSYRILSLLGAGGMGEVYRAYDEKLQREVAIKVLPPAAAADQAAGARLLREARAAAALNHPNICSIHEVGDQGGQAFIAMELIEGDPLDRVVPSGTGLPVDGVLAYGSQIAEALVHAHERGVLHRDLKTANVVITRGRRAKVLDFGLAKRVAHQTDASMETASTLTATGTVAGTLAYMAPEQLRGLPGDARSDVWALGVVLYNMAAGQSPFAGQTAYELSSAILSEPARPLPARIPRNLQSVIGRCLDKDATGRFQSAGEVLAALEAVRAGIAPVSLPRLPVTGRTLAGIAAMLLVGSIGGVLLNVAGVRERLWAPQPLFDSIAVLPLQDASGDTNAEYLTGGIQQALITELAQLPGFTKVISRGSTLRFRNTDQPSGEIARALGVRALVTGSILRAGGRVQISAQLIDAATERQVWGGTYERDADDVIGLQNDVVTDVAKAIELRLTPADRKRLEARTTVKPETYELYLRGMHELTGSRRGEEGDLATGLKYLQEAIDKDPGDPHAWAGLAIGYATLGHSPASPDDAWIRARSAADRALTLAPDLAEAHAVMGDVKLYYEWDWAGAERAFRRTNELNPNVAMNHYRYAWHLYLVDRLDEAIIEHERARDLDPLTPVHGAWLADLYRAAGRYDDAIAAAQKSLEINPRSSTGWYVLSRVYSDLGKHDDAIAAGRRLAESARPWTFALGVAHARAGRIDEARAILREVEGRPRHSYNMWARAMLHLYLGDADEFFTAIAHEPHHAFVPWVRMEPGLERFRSDPRYTQLMARFNLPVPKAPPGGSR